MRNDKSFYLNKGLMYSIWIMIMFSQRMYVYIMWWRIDYYIKKEPELNFSNARLRSESIFFFIVAWVLIVLRGLWYGRNLSGFSHVRPQRLHSRITDSTVIGLLCLRSVCPTDPQTAVVALQGATNNTYYYASTGFIITGQVIIFH